MKFLAGFLLLSATVLAQGKASSIVGTWEGTATYRGQSVPLHLTISGKSSSLQAALVNGSTSSAASAVTFADGHLQITFNYFASTLDAMLSGETLTGNFTVTRTIPVVLHRAAKAAAPTLDKPEILGDWEIATRSTKGESAWQLRIARSDAPEATVRAVIQRIDGDTGALYGKWSGDSFLVSQFSPIGPELYRITPQADGTLLVANLLSSKPDPLVARRPAEARKENLPPPTDTTEQTTIKDPNARFTFSFPDLAGKLVSNTDPQFDGKVIILTIGGSWCPNCHDEAPLLESLYKQFHSRGLEIVNVSFEEEDQLKDPRRLRAFIQHYGITYDVLLGGTTDQLNEKFTQANNLNCWPTSFFIGRDGKVKEIHAGFAGPGNPEEHQVLTREINVLVEHLLAEPTPTQSASLAR